MNNFVAGLLSGLVLAFVFVGYMLARGRSLVTFFKEPDENFARLSDKTLFSIVLACFLGAALLFGLLSGLVYSWVGSGPYFSGLAIGLAILLSILALVSKQPLIPDKIFWNFAVGGVLGLLTPLLAA